MQVLAVVGQAGQENQGAAGQQGLDEGIVEQVPAQKGGQRNENCWAAGQWRYGFVYLALARMIDQADFFGGWYQDQRKASA